MANKICAATFLQNNFQKNWHWLHLQAAQANTTLQPNFCQCSQSMNILFGDRYTALSLEIILRLHQAARKHIQFLIIKNMNVNASNNPPFSVTFAKIRVPKCRTGSEELISQHVSISCKLLHILISDSRLLVNHGVAHCRL